MIATSAQRREMARDRLGKLLRLRAMPAPRWVIKSEQIAMVLNRKGMKHTRPGATPSKTQGDLYVKHVCPLLAGDGQ
jgi:hypothetical protein